MPRGSLAVELQQIVGCDDGGVMVAKGHQQDAAGDHQPSGTHHALRDVLVVHKPRKHQVGQELDHAQRRQQALRSKPCSNVEGRGGALTSRGAVQCDPAEDD